MGLTFHYSGRIRDYKQLDSLIEEVADLAKGLNWTHSILDDDQIKGIIVDAPESEPLWFTFTPDGKTCDVVNLQYSDPSEPHYSLCHTKTQFAGPEVHMAMIRMLRHISDKYFSEIEVTDEGEYWEKGDEENLRRIFGNYNDILDLFAKVLQKMERIPGESSEATRARIEQMVKEEMEGVEVVVVRNDEQERSMGNRQ